MTMGEEKALRQIIASFAETLIKLYSQQVNNHLFIYNEELMCLVFRDGDVM